MYTYQTSVKLHDTDAAGVLFFANYFRLTHEAYESFMASVGFDFYHIIHQAEYIVLIVHAECDFKRPLYVGNKVAVEIRAGNIGKTSFTLNYTVVDEPGNVVASGNSVHVCVDKPGFNSVVLPEGLRSALEAIV